MLAKNNAVLTAAFLVASLPAGAATIKYVGSTTETREAVHWRTNTVKKTLDLSGYNVYGNMGVVIWTHGSAGEQKAPSAALGWVYVGGGDQVGLPKYVAVDDQGDATKQVPAGIVLKNFDFQLTGAPSDYAGKTVRFGVMQDVLGKDENAADTFKAMQLIQTTGSGSGDSGIQVLRHGSAGTGSPTIYFFDLTNVKPGDTFSIKALTDQGGKSGLLGYIGPVCWDIKSQDAK